MFRPKKKGEAATKSPLSDFANQYTLTATKLGSGSYAEVKLGINKKSGQTVAVKIIDKQGMTDRELKKLHKEVEILKGLRHKNVVRFYDSFEEEATLYIVMEYVTGGELFAKIVDDSTEMTESNIKRIVRTMALALKYCKEKGVIHRDIKPENVLLTNDADGEPQIKLADFNLSIKVDPETTEFSVLQTMCGTPNYVAPEVLSGLPYDYKCDVWSLGVITYLLLSGGYLPFYVDEEGEEGRRLLLQKVKRGKWEFTPEFAWSEVSDQAKHFLLNVMNRKPEERFSYEQILAHPWLKINEKTHDIVEGENEHVIDFAELSKYNTKRKMLALAMVKSAVEEFAKNMMQSDMNLTEKFLGNQSGTDAFKELI